MGPESYYRKRKNTKARVADGRELAIEEHTRLVNVTILAPWAPAEGN